MCLRVCQRSCVKIELPDVFSIQFTGSMKAKIDSFLTSVAAAVIVVTFDIRPWNRFLLFCLFGIICCPFIDTTEAFDGWFLYFNDERTGMQLPVHCMDAIVPFFSQSSITVLNRKAIRHATELGCLFYDPSHELLTVMICLLVSDVNELLSFDLYFI